MAGCNAQDALGEPSADAIRVFGLIADGIPVDECDADFVAELVAWGVVVWDGEHKNKPVALDPKAVAHRRMRAELQQAAARVALMSRIPDVTDQLAQEYERSQWRAGGGSEYIDDKDVVNARLDDVVGSAEWEILAAQPGGPREQALLERAVARDTAAVERGVSLRTLYRATVRDNAVTAKFARTMSGRGGEYRTLVGPFERAIVVDRRVAFISNHLVEGAPEHAAWQVTDRAMVAYIVAEYEAKWRLADPWQGELRTARAWSVDTVSGVDGVRTTRRQREIMRDQCEGIPQEVTARRLGMSRRTVSNEINDLKVRFGASSLMQLAVKWSLSPDRLVDDSDLTVDGQDGQDGTAAA